VLCSPDDNGNGSDMPWGVFIRGLIVFGIWGGAVGAIFGGIFGGGVGDVVFGVILGVMFLPAIIAHIMFRVFRWGR